MVRSRNSPIMIDPTNSFGYGAIPARVDPGNLLESARQTLQQQAAGGSQEVRRESAAPDHQMYGIFGPQYAASLARPTGSSGGDLLNRTALMMNAENEREAYARALEAAGSTALRQAQMEGYYDVLPSLIAREPEGTFAGMRSLRINPETGVHELIYDPVERIVNNQLAGNEQLSETRENNATAIEKLYGAGIMTPPETASGYMTAPTQATPDSYGVFNQRGFNPGDENTANELPIKQLQAEAAMLGAEASMTRAQNGDQPQYTEQWFPGATEPVRTFRGTGPGQVQSMQGGDSTQMTPQQQQRVQSLQRHGIQHTMSGNILVVVNPQNGRQYLYGPDGELVQQQGAPSSGGAQ